MTAEEMERDSVRFVACQWCAWIHGGVGDDAQPSTITRGSDVRVGERFVEIYTQAARGREVGRGLRKAARDGGGR